MNHFAPAWQLFVRDAGQWVLFALIMAVVIVCTCGLGVMLVGPNMLLVARAAVRDGRPPVFGELLRTDNFVDRLLALLIVVVASTVSSVVPVVGPLLVAVLMSWVMPLVIDGRYGAVEAVQASFHHAKTHFIDLLVFNVVAAVILSVSAAVCGLPALVTLPWVLLTQWCYYEASVDEIVEAATAAGVQGR